MVRYNIKRYQSSEHSAPLWVLLVLSSGPLYSFSRRLGSRLGLLSLIQGQRFHLSAPPWTHGQNTTSCARQMYLKISYTCHSSNIFSAPPAFLTTFLALAFWALLGLGPGSLAWCYSEFAFWTRWGCKETVTQYPRAQFCITLSRTTPLDGRNLPHASDGSFHPYPTDERRRNDVRSADITGASRTSVSFCKASSTVVIS